VYVDGCPKCDMQHLHTADDITVTRPKGPCTMVLREERMKDVLESF